MRPLGAATHASCDDDVADLRRPTRCAAQHLAFDDDAAADAGAQREHDQMPLASSGPVPELAQGGHIGIVIHHHCQPQLFFDQIAQRYVLIGNEPIAFVVAKVGRPADHTAWHIDMSRHGDADRPDLVQGHLRLGGRATHYLADPPHRPRHAGLGVRGGLSAAQQLLVSIHDGGAHVRAAQIDAHDVGRIRFRLYAGVVHAEFLRRIDFSLPAKYIPGYAVCQGEGNLQGIPKSRDATATRQIRKAYLKPTSYARGRRWHRTHSYGKTSPRNCAPTAFAPRPPQDPDTPRPACPPPT